MNAFQIAHSAHLAQLAKATAPNISNYPTAEEVLDVREHVEAIAVIVDSYLQEIFAESRFMGSVALPHQSQVTPLEDYLHDNSIAATFNRAALDFPRRKRA